MKFEIMNQSDPYTMDAVDLEIAAVAVCLLGNGKYALNGMGEDDGEDVPIFIFGGHDEWFMSKFGMDYNDTATKVLNHRNAEIVDALYSVTLEREERSSMNDIGGRAHEMAGVLARRAIELAIIARADGSEV